MKIKVTEGCTAFSYTVNDKEWDKFYCGTDGAFTMYIDAVEQKYAMSSTNPNKYDLVGDIKSIFSNINSQVKQ